MGYRFFMQRWEKYFVVLSNVGLLFFDDPHDEYPKKMFPLNGGIMHVVDPIEVDGATTVFMAEFDA